MFPILNPPPSPYHPSGSSPCTSPKHPVSYIEHGLVTCFIYDIIHVSMPFSQIIPPSPSLTESKRLFYTSVSLLLCISTQGLGKVLTYTEISRNAAIMSSKQKIIGCVWNITSCGSLFQKIISLTAKWLVIWQSLTHCTCTGWYMWPLRLQRLYTYNI